MDTSPSQDSSLDYKSAADTCDVQSTESWLGLGGSEEAGVGPSRRHMASSPMSISDSLQCMALDSDFSDVEDELGVALKARRRGNTREVDPLLGANEASLIPEDMEEPAAFMLSGPSKRAGKTGELMLKVWVAGGWNVAQHHTLPDWLKDNDFLHQGHRVPTHSFMACFKSIFLIHSETGNIWTHLLGMLGFLAIAGYFLTRPAMEVPVQEKAVFSVFFFGSILCLSFSWVFHTVCCHSRRVGLFFNKLDYCGISLMIMGSFVPWLYYSFYCCLLTRTCYMLLLLLLGSGSIVMCLFDKFAHPRYRPLRTYTFGCQALSGVVPGMHYVLSEGFWHAVDEAAMGWLLLMAVLYICAAVIYVKRFPERLFPGKCDIWFQSHQLLHVLVLVAALVHFHGIVTIADYRLTTGPCPATSLS